MAILVSWEFLLRVQSEGLQLWIGKASDKDCLPQGRNNGLWVDQDNNLCLRLRTRKNIKCGITMRRACMCWTGEVPRKTCAVHVFKEYAKNRNVGDLITDLNPHEFTRTMKSALMSLNEEKAEQFTCKACRAGRATELVKQNVAFGEVLDMGGWSTKHAARRYIREEIC